MITNKLSFTRFHSHIASPGLASVTLLSLQDIEGGTFDPIWAKNRTLGWTWQDDPNAMAAQLRLSVKPCEVGSVWHEFSWLMLERGWLATLVAIVPRPFGTETEHILILNLYAPVAAPQWRLRAQNVAAGAIRPGSSVFAAGKLATVNAVSTDGYWVEFASNPGPRLHFGGESVMLVKKGA